jgi:undecaprenyl-diphosphatase
VWLVLALLAALSARRWQVFAWVALADGVAQLSAVLLQVVIGRDRPHAIPLIPEPHSHSFPSGHAASSFACAFVLSALAPRFRRPLYALAVLMALSRLYVGVHYPLDVVAGSVWGLLLGAATLELGAAMPASARPRPSRLLEDAEVRLDLVERGEGEHHRE